MICKKNLAEAGQTLLEILLAFSVSVLVLSAIVIGVTGSLNNANFTKNQNLANSYAQEGMAVIRQIRDSSWKNFISTITNKIYCLASVVLEDDDGLECKVNGKVGIFARSVVSEHDSEDCSNEEGSGTKVTVKVAWSDSKCPSSDNVYCHSVKLISCFSNIDQREGP